MLLSGLPRTGATVLGSIFAQNPDVHFSGHSPLVPLVHGVKEATEGAARENLIMLNKYDGFAKRAMQNMVNFYYQDVDAPTIIDKGRSWCCEANRYYAKECFEGNEKHIILVRPLDEIVKSFVALRQANHWNGDIFSDLLDEGSDPIMWPLTGVFYSKFMDCKDTLFLSFKDVVDDTKNTLNRISDFLGINRFDYCLTEIQEAVAHNDGFLSLNGLHDVRKTVSARNYNIELPSHIQQKCDEYNNRMINLGITFGLTG